ncbi:TIGR03086 family metal-binding protein [soil metagenome]
MDTTAAQYQELAERFAGIADAVDAARWDAPSPCEGWSAADVIDHIVTTQRDFLGSHDIDVGQAPDVAADPAKAWHAHADAVAGALAQPGVAETTFNGFFGPTTVGETLARFYGFDMIVHRWDLAQAGGVTTTFSDAELDQIETSIDGFGEHLYAEGICKPAVHIAADASRQHRLLARMGRDPRGG